MDSPRPTQHDESVDQQQVCGQMKQVERPDQPRIRLQEFPEEALGGVETGEDVEPVTSGALRLAAQPKEEGERKTGHGKGFVELHRMAMNAVAEIHAPGQAGWRAVGIVREPGGETAEAS